MRCERCETIGETVGVLRAELTEANRVIEVLRHKDAKHVKMILAAQTELAESNSKLKFCENCLEIQAKSAKSFQLAWHDANIEIGKIEQELEMARERVKELESHIRQIKIYSACEDEVEMECDNALAGEEPKSHAPMCDLIYVFGGRCNCGAEPKSRGAE